jgi:hypothetical protein
MGAKKQPPFLRGLPGLYQPERGTNSATPVAALTFRYCLLHDLGKPGGRGYSLWLVPTGTSLACQKLPAFYAASSRA